MHALSSIADLPARRRGRGDHQLRHEVGDARSRWPRRCARRHARAADRLRVRGRQPREHFAALAHATACASTGWSGRCARTPRRSTACCARCRPRRCCWSTPTSRFPTPALIGDDARRPRRRRDAYGAGLPARPRAGWTTTTRCRRAPAWYAQRMWIPLTLLRTAPVRDLLGGVGFDTRRSFSRAAWLGHLACSLGVANPPRSLVRWRRAPGASDAAAEPSPVFVEYDTGARCTKPCSRAAVASRPFRSRDGATCGTSTASRARCRAAPGGRSSRGWAWPAPDEPAASPAFDEALVRLEAAYGIDVAGRAHARLGELRRQRGDPPPEHRRRPHAGFRRPACCACASIDRARPSSPLRSWISPRPHSTRAR